MKKRTKLLLLLIILILLTVFGVVFWKRMDLKKSTFKIKNETAKMEDAKKYGDDITGWLRVEGTNIDLPLVESNNEADVERNDYDFAWTNSHPDSKSNHPSFISHNIRNISSNPIIGDKTMIRFEQLMSFIYPNFIKKNQYIEYTNERGETSLYRIYAVALFKDDQSKAYRDTYSDEEQQKYIEDAKKESIYDMNVDVNKKDLLLTLMTCTRFYGETDSYSFQIDARKLREGEDTMLAKIKTTKKYQKIENRMKEGDKNEEI